MVTFQIRPAVPEDIDDIIELCAEHAKHEQAEYSSEGKKEKLSRCLFGSRPQLYCLVVEDQKSGIVGYATYSQEFSTWEADFFIHVDCLYLRPKARNRRIGWILGKHIARAALELDAQTIQFQTPPFNTPAIRIYEAMGARRKEKVRFYADRQDMLNFVGLTQFAVVENGEMRSIQGLNQGCAMDKSSGPQSIG